MTKKKHVLTSKQYEAFLHIATTLNETQKAPRAQLMNIMRVCGQNFCENILKETLRINQEGGMKTLDGKKQRTPGGLFFYLARSLMTDEQRDEIFSRQSWSNRKTRWRKFDWSQRHKVISELNEDGRVDEMRVTLIGKAGQISHEADVVITRMAHTSGDVSLPGGLPPFPEHKTIYTVYIAKQQWDKVESKVKDSDEQLVVQGLAFDDPDVKGITVFATDVKTRKNRTAKEVKAGHGTEQSNKASSTVKTQSDKSITRVEPLVLTEKTQIDTKSEQKSPQPLKPENMSAVDLKRYDELIIAAEQFRLKIADLEAKPEGKRTGLTLTQKLLANTEKQLATIREKYQDNAG